MKLFKLIRACIVFNLPLRSYHITMHLWQRALRACFHVTIVFIVGRVFNDRSLSSSFCLKYQLPVLIGYKTRDITCEGQKHSFVSNKMSPKHHINRYKQHPLQSSSSLSIRASFCICFVIYTFL